MMTSAEAIRIALDDSGNHSATAFDVAATLFVGDAGNALRQLCETKAALNRATSAAKAEETNGWRNAETWLASLWLDNDSGTYAMAREIAKAAPSDIAAGEAIRDAMAEVFDLPESGYITDMIGVAQSRIDWRAIGEHFRTE